MKRFLAFLSLVLLSTGPGVGQEVAPANPTAVDPLLVKLIDAINAGKLPGRTGADAKGYKNGADAVAWNALEAADLARLYFAAGFRDEDLVTLAQWAWKSGLAPDAERALYRYVQSDKKRQPRVEEILSGWRGVRLPAGGYVYDAKHGWEDVADRLNRLAAEKIDGLCKQLSTATDPKVLDKVFAEILVYYQAPEVRKELKGAIKFDIVDALMSSKERRLKAIEAKAKSAAGFKQLSAMKLELNKRREAALKLIYDRAIYLPEDHPDWRKGDKINGQEKVDELVLKSRPGSVEELWETAGSVVAALDPSIKKDVELISELDGKYLSELGERPEKDDLKAYERIIANLNKKIDLKTFALDAKEADLYAYNRRVDAYNEALAEPGVGKEEKDHLEVINDYREMMGRRRLFIDARLCRATKKHSDAQNAAKRIWHVGPDGDPQSRAKAEGFTDGVGENVAIGYGHPGDIWWRGWYRASDHHRNALSDRWNAAGYGYVGNVGTQNFAQTALPKGLGGK